MIYTTRHWVYFCCELMWTCLSVMHGINSASKSVCNKIAIELIIPRAIFLWIGIIGEDTLYKFVMILLKLNKDKSKGTILYKGCLLIYFHDGLYII